MCFRVFSSYSKVKKQVNKINGFASGFASSAERTRKGGDGVGDVASITKVFPEHERYAGIHSSIERGAVSSYSFIPGGH
jgi:hypothetical protein